MYETTIKVSGPGSCINNELAVISKALSDAGFVVEIENEYPAEDVTEDELVARITRLNQTRNPKSKIKIVADHQPWGG